MRLILVLTAFHCLAFIDRTMIGGLLPLLRRSIAMTDAQAGWIVGTAFALPYGLAALAVAALRRGQPASRLWLAGGVTIWTAGSLGTGLAGSLGTLAAARAALGIGQGLFVPMSIARLIDGTRPEARGRALGLFTGGATFGRSTALLAVGSLLTLVGPLAAGSGIAPWRWLFIVTAAPNVLVLVFLLASGPASAGRMPEPVRQATDWRSLLPFFLVAVAPVLLAQAVLAWLPTLFVRDRGLSTADAALLIGTVTLVAAPAGPVIAGWFVGRFRTWEDRTPLLVLCGLATTLVLLAALVHARSLVAAVAGMAAMLVALGIASFAGLFGVQLRIPPPARVSVNGVYLAFVTMVGAGLGPLLTGVIASGADGDKAGLGPALLVTGAVATGACALAVLATRPGTERAA